jgi:hypothetical protein
MNLASRRPVDASRDPDFHRDDVGPLKVLAAGP